MHPRHVIGSPGRRVYWEVNDLEPVISIAILLASLYVVLWIFILLPARMATARGRSAILWVLLSLLISPILACLLLLLLGNGAFRRV